MPKTIEINGIPADQLDAVREVLRNDGANGIESIEQNDGSFTLKAVMPEGSEAAGRKGLDAGKDAEAAYDAEQADEADSDLPGDPDFPTD